MGGVHFTLAAHAKWGNVYNDLSLSTRCACAKIAPLGITPFK